jgi:hypothetical protein
MRLSGRLLAEYEQGPEFNHCLVINPQHRGKIKRTKEHSISCILKTNKRVFLAMVTGPS